VRERERGGERERERETSNVVDLNRGARKDGTKAREERGLRGKRSEVERRVALSLVLS